MPGKCQYIFSVGARPFEGQIAVILPTIGKTVIVQPQRQTDLLVRAQVLHQRTGRRVAARRIVQVLDSLDIRFKKRGATDLHQRGTDILVRSQQTGKSQ
ncbi:hypothetical protein D9M71_821080 [compost metagenome]